jgi:hypothetical protein
MVRHQAVTEQAEAMLRSLFPQQAKVHCALGIRVENELPRVAPLGNVVRNVNGNDARQTGHAAQTNRK